jgi:hypothetical protein
LCRRNTPSLRDTTSEKRERLNHLLSYKELTEKEKLKHFKTKEASNAAKQKKLTRKLIITRF